MQDNRWRPSDSACQSLYCFVHNLIKIIRIKPQRILMYL